MENFLYGNSCDIYKVPIYKTDAETVVNLKYSNYSDSFPDNLISLNDTYIFLFIQKGSLIFNINGNDLICTSRDILLIKPDANFDLPNKQSDCNFLIMCFSFVSNEDELMFNSRQTGNSKKALRYESYLHQKLAPCSHLLPHIKNYIAGRENTKQLTQTLLADILYLIKTEHELLRHFHRNSPYTFTESAKEYIDKNYSKDIRISDIAQQVLVSESYLTHCFTNEYGISPKKYLLAVRISVAKKMLTETKMPCGKIAAIVGFTSPQRFNDVFRKSENISPTAYRNSFSNKSYSL